MKLALVTGASSGIGKAAAQHFAEDGYHVVLVARNLERLKQASNEIGDSTTIASCDVSCGKSTLELAETIKRDIGLPDVVVNAAGAGQWKFIEDTTPREALEMIQAPYLAAFNVTHAFMKEMLDRRSGVFIQVNSGAALSPWPSSTGYSSARWALRGLNEALCQDLRKTGVKSCNLVLGRVDSPYFGNNPESIEALPGIARSIRTLSCDECGRIILWLAKHPRRQLVYPYLLRVYGWMNHLFPGVVRYLIWKTGKKRVDG